MKNIIKLSNLPFLLLVVYIAKSFIVGSSFFDFGVITLMSFSFLYKLNLDKDILTDKEELKTIISQLESKVNKKIDEIEKGQNRDRVAAEGKFSTLNLGLQRQPKTPQEKATYGWGR